MTSTKTAKRKTQFYDWEKTLSYDADVTMVVSKRGIGKTFGLRLQCIRDFLRDGSRFCEITRYKNELSDVADGYYSRLSRMPEFKDYLFKSDARYAWIAKKPDTEKEKPAWMLSGYFVALSEQQKKKKKTFDKVRRMIFDEAILERTDCYHRYLPGEFSILTNLVSTVSRERADTQGVRPRVYLLGNACDLANPYFAAYQVGTDLKFGYRWYANKEFLLHYVDPDEYDIEGETGTVAGRMFAHSNGGKVALSNEFVRANTEFVKQKTKKAKFNFGIVCNGMRFGVWLDQSEGFYYVTDKIPNNTHRPVYSLTRADASINYIAATRLGVTMRYVSEMYSYNLLRYENETVMMQFGEVLRMFGIR